MEGKELTVQQKMDKNFHEKLFNAVVNNLNSGKSVLTEAREGIKYAQNASNGTAYKGVNQLLLQQRMKDSGFKNPFFVTSTQGLRDFAVSIEKGQISTQLSTFNPDGKKWTHDYTDPKTNITHKAGEIIRTAEGKPFTGADYYWVYNAEQLDTRRVINREELINNPNDKDITIQKSPIRMFVAEKKESYDQLIPFDKTIVKGEHYKAKNPNDPVDKFVEATSAYLNSCYTGAAYKGYSFSQEEINKLGERFKPAQDKTFNADLSKAIAFAGYTATGVVKDSPEISLQNAFSGKIRPEQKAAMEAAEPPVQAHTNTNTIEKTQTKKRSR